jgi:hypothetical protein
VDIAADEDGIETAKTVGQKAPKAPKALGLARRYNRHSAFVLGTVREELV